LVKSKARAEIKSKRMAKGTRMNIPPTNAIVLYNMDGLTDVDPAQAIAAN